MPSHTHDFRKDREQWAQSLRDRAANERRMREAEKVRERRRAAVLKGRRAKAALGCERSLEWLRRWNEVRAYVAALTGGAGRKHADTPDGWSYSEGKYTRG